MALSVGGHWIEVDCLWRAERLVLELDGRAVHATHRRSSATVPATAPFRLRAGGRFA